MVFPAPTSPALLQGKSQGDSDGRQIPPVVSMVVIVLKLASAFPNAGRKLL